MRIILIGFMGSGKSSIAQLLHAKIKWPVLDTDALLEAKYKKKISDIFAELGEEKFREYETEVLKDILNQDQMIISTGGGIVEKERNHALLKHNSKVIYLKTTPEAVLKFTSADKNRPLLNVENPEKIIRDRLTRREPIYKNLCDFEISSFDKSLQQSADDILKLIKL